MYNTKPKLIVTDDIKTFTGYETIFKEILKNKNVRTISIECFPGVDVKNVVEQIQELNYEELIIETTDNYFIENAKITDKLQSVLSNDRVFGRFNQFSFQNFYANDTPNNVLDKLQDNKIYVLIGVGASDMIHADLTVYMNITKWNIQLDFKAGNANWKADNENEEFLKKVKRAYYFEWPAADEIKKNTIPLSDYVIDVNEVSNPKMISADDYLKVLKKFSAQPFRLVPYFEPGVWGGHWMQEKFNVGKDKTNLAWCFDGVPEENSILVEINKTSFEFPGNDVVYFYPVELLGEKVFGRFGSDFPIRFDFLDTMGGGNLSLQVHPTLDYAYRKFGVKYTQDESYYIMDCSDNAFVYIGLKKGVTKKEFIDALKEGQAKGQFEAEKYVNKIPVKKHDHILIPAGTVHCSGKDCVVLEISATPNRFTFKLWDWGRVDLDGKPRPIHLEHGEHVINERMDTDRVKSELINHVKEIDSNEDRIAENTGLHPLESIETNRYTFSKPYNQTTGESVNMLNLVEGSQIMIESLDDTFNSQIINYGETFIVPESVNKYRVIPLNGEECKLIRAIIK